MKRHRATTRPASPFTSAFRVAHCRAAGRRRHRSEVVAAAAAILQRVRPDVECVEGIAGGAALERTGNALPDETRALCERSVAFYSAASAFHNTTANHSKSAPIRALFIAPRLRAFCQFAAGTRFRRTRSGIVAETGTRSRARHGRRARANGRHLFRNAQRTAPGRRRRRSRRHDDHIALPRSNGSRASPSSLARVRNRRLTSVDKQNILETSRLWRRVVDQIAKEYPDVTLDHLLVDNAAMQLVRRPRDFDVIVTENMFGDILSDEAAILTGSIGTLPSASLGTRETAGGRFGLVRTDRRHRARHRRPRHCKPNGRHTFGRNVVTP